MFWDNVAWVYDIFANAINRKVISAKMLKRTEKLIRLLKLDYVKV